MFKLQDYEDCCASDIDLQCILAEQQSLTAKTNKIYAAIRKNLLEKESEILLAKEDKHLVQL